MLHLRLLLPGLVLVLSARGAEPLDLRSAPLLLADDSALVSYRSVVRTVHPARTRSDPMLVADRPWEGDRVYTYGSLDFEPESRRYRLWYMSRTQRPDGTKPAPQLRNGGLDVVLLATSGDGWQWEKPVLGLHAHGGSTANNIVFDAHSPAVVRDRFERDPAKRFKLLAYASGNYITAYSADGVHWREFGGAPAFTGSDTMSMTQNPVTGEFLAFFKRRPAPGDAVQGRAVWLTRSRDFKVWSEPRLVLTTDAEDNRWITQPGQSTEIYNMAVRPHAGGYLGFPTVFRVITRTERSAPIGVGQSRDDGAIDVQLVTSVDGETWQRSWPRVSIIPRGAPGAFDGGTILGVTSSSLDVGDETWLAYTAINTGHGGPIPPKRISIGRATWRRHGFVSLDASPSGGRIETRPLLLGEGGLVINADASRGELRAALLERDGRPMAGYGLEDFAVLRTDATRSRARWGDRAAPSDRPVRVVIQMTSTRLYSLASAEDAHR